MLLFVLYLEGYKKLFRKAKNIWRKELYMEPSL